MNMPDYTFNQHGIAFDWGNMPSHRGPRQLVAFYPKAVLDMQQTRLEGRPVYEKQEYITVQMPGEILQIIDKPATDLDRSRWPQQYAAYKNSSNYVPEGTPVDLLFPTSPEIVATLKSHGIHVIEDLVSLTPNGIQQIGLGCQEWINKGNEYLAMAKQGVDFHQIEQLKKKHEQELAAVQNQLVDQQRQMNNLLAELRAKTPEFASSTAIAAAAQASSVPQNRPMPAVPEAPKVADPASWPAPAEGTVERRDHIKSKLRSQLRGAQNDGVTFKEGE